MHALDGALNEFEVAPTTAVTVVDRISSAELLAARGGRRPEDARADRIVLYPNVRSYEGTEPNVTFWGSSAWSLADLMLVAWADTLRLGRTARVEFAIRFGDGTSYTGAISISRGIRRGRARLAEHCRRLETFAACFCPSANLPEDERKVSAMLDYFLKNYEIGSPLATAQRSRTRKATPVPAREAPSAPAPTHEPARAA